VAEPTGGLTFRELVVRVAEYLGVAYYGSDGTSEAQVPTDGHDLGLCKRLVNDGIRMFINDHHDWRWMRKLHTLTVTNSSSPLQVAGDTGRYFMPEDFGGDARGHWTFGPDQNVWPEIITIDEVTIREWRSIHAGNQTGIPRYAAFRPLPDEDIPQGQRARWEVLFYPDPGQAYVVQLPYRHYFNNLVSLDADRQPAGFEHDETIKAAALAQAELDRDDTLGARGEYYKKCLENSKRIDLLSVPKTVGPNLDRSSRMQITKREDLGYSRPVLPPTYNG
jgi:hypothetical protein